MPISSISRLMKGAFERGKGENPLRIIATAVLVTVKQQQLQQQQQ